MCGRCRFIPAATIFSWAQIILWVHTCCCCCYIMPFRDVCFSTVTTHANPQCYIRFVSMDPACSRSLTFQSVSMIFAPLNATCPRIPSSITAPLSARCVIVAHPGTLVHVPGSLLIGRTHLRIVLQGRHHQDMGWCRQPLHADI